MKLNHFYSAFYILLFLASCKQEQKVEEISPVAAEVQASDPLEKIKVLNFGSFHMGFTPDANTTKFNEHDVENQKMVKSVAAQLARFKPTVILVERLPQNDSILQGNYNTYLKDPNTVYEAPTELELLAFEVGRLSDTKRIYGIDHRLDYNYNIGNEIENTIDSMMYQSFFNNPYTYYPEIDENQDSLNVIDKLLMNNTDVYLDFLIEINADMLTHAGTDEGFEGADQATEYYRRNLRMYSNMNRIKLTKEDRVFILMGASHTAFFRDFISRSPKYEMVKTFDYFE